MAYLDLISDVPEHVIVWLLIKTDPKRRRLGIEPPVRKRVGHPKGRIIGAATTNVRQKERAELYLPDAHTTAKLLKGRTLTVDFAESQRAFEISCIRTGASS